MMVKLNAKPIFPIAVSKFQLLGAIEIGVAIIHESDLALAIDQDQHLIPTANHRPPESRRGSDGSIEDFRKHGVLISSFEVFGFVFYFFGAGLIQPPP